MRGWPIVWRRGRMGCWLAACTGFLYRERLWARACFLMLPMLQKSAWPPLLHLKMKGYVLHDTQFLTPHLETLGVTEIPRKVYEQRLREALRLQCTWNDNYSDHFF